MTKVANAKTMFSLLLIVFLSFLLVVPAHALGEPYDTHVSSFPIVRESGSHVHSTYSGIIQKFMWGYSNSTRAAIINNGGSIDGYYGPKTASAVRIFQSEWGLGTDGEVGPITWANISVRLTESSPDYSYGDNRRPLVTAYSHNNGVKTAMVLDNGTNYLYYYYGLDDLPRCVDVPITKPRY